MIVRVVEVPAGASLAVLDGVLAACLGWAGEGPAVFTVRAVSYSRTAMLGVLSTGAVTVGSLGLRVGERFTWCPDVTTSWVVDVRVDGLAQDACVTDAAGACSRMT